MSEKNYTIKVGDKFPAKRVRNLFRVCRNLRLKVVIQFNCFKNEVEIIELREVRKLPSDIQKKMNVEDTCLMIGKLNTVEDIEKAIEFEDRKGVLEFANNLIEELKK